QAPAAAQAPVNGTAADSLPALREHLARDSTDGRAWLLLGRLYLERVADAHDPPHRALGDSAAVRALLDSADDALDRAGRLLAPSGSTPDGDSARVLRVAAWSARSHLAWEQRGINVGPQKRRPVRVTVAFDRPPGPRIGWSTRPLLWVAGPHLKDDRVPPRDFVFAALRLALDDNDAWAQPALALYARAARATPALCEALKTFRLTNEIPSCRR